MSSLGYPSIRNNRIEDNDFNVAVVDLPSSIFFIMDWDIYKRKFREEVNKRRYADNKRYAYISRCLSYAKILYDQNMPIIFDNKHLSLLLGFDSKLLYKISNNQEKFYTKFYIRKKTTGLREISEPMPTLKEIQKWILNNILYQINISKFAKAFRKNYSIKTNARFHVNQDYVLSLDIKEFFPSIKLAKIYSIFLGIGYCKQVAMMLTKLCCLDNSLPQGAPTSPALSNIVAQKIDNRVGGFAVKFGLRYTRYADDITISGPDFHPGSIIKFVEKVLNENEFELNHNKTRLMRPHERQVVTGITVNKKLNASKGLRRSIRKDLYYIRKYGINSHLDRVNIKRKNYIPHVIGLIDFILFLRPNDIELKEAKRWLISQLI
jgi:RNA-directed DNA polymerase